MTAFPEGWTLVSVGPRESDDPLDPPPMPMWAASARHSDGRTVRVSGISEAAALDELREVVRRSA